MFAKEIGVLDLPSSIVEFISRAELSLSNFIILLLDSYLYLWFPSEDFERPFYTLRLSVDILF